MMESVESIQSERGEVKRACQAFRDLALLLVLILLLLSVRVDGDEAESKVQPLPGGVQAAGHEQAEPVSAAPSAVPALSTSDPADEPGVPPVARLREFQPRVEAVTRVLLLRDGTVHEILLPAPRSTATSEERCSGRSVDVLTSS